MCVLFLAVDMYLKQGTFILAQFDVDGPKKHLIHEGYRYYRNGGYRAYPKSGNLANWICASYFRDKCQVKCKARASTRIIDGVEMASFRAWHNHPPELPSFSFKHCK